MTAQAAQQVRRSAWLPIAALLVILGLPGLALAQVEQTIFGPKQYDHPTSDTSRTVDTVRVPAIFTGPFTLRIRNGEEREGVRDASVYLNGARILGYDDFGSKTVELERTVQLQPENRLVVVIEGRPRTRLTLSISGRRIPALPSALAPDPLTLITGNAGVLSATLSPPPAVAGALAVASDDASVASVPLSVAFAAEQTLVTIPVTARTVGNTTVSASLNGRSVSAAVRVVPEPPRIDAIAPASGAAGTLVTLSGAFFDPAPAANQVSFAGADGAPVTAAVIAASASQVTVRVPERAVSGPITLTDSRGRGESAPFMLLPLAARLELSRAGLTARNTNLSSPVTPFVQGAIPGDALSFELPAELAAPEHGKAKVDDNNKLVYETALGFNGSDKFQYRVRAAADDSTLIGTALVKVFGTAPGQTPRCTSPSILVSGALQRINVTNCSFYGEVLTRTTAAGAPVTVQYVALRPADGTAPKAAVFLIGGGDFNLNFNGDPATGAATLIGGNFLVRSAQLFANAGYLAIAMNRPSDQPPAGSVDVIGDVDRYRISVDHAADILALLREVNTDHLEVFLAGTSRGALSAVAANLIASGISLSSAVSRRSAVIPSRMFVGDDRHPNLVASFVQRPTHVLRNLLDACTLTRPIDQLNMFNAFLAAGVQAELSSVSGGFVVDTDPCDAFTFHGYLGIEPTAVLPVTTWLDARVAALGGNKRPAAAFAELPVASGSSIAIDLTALTGDAEGDALTYALSHVGSSLGGSVTLEGATVTYTPPAGAANVIDRFVYVVTDGRGGVSAAVISIRIGG
jgi:hypothetical protein